MRGLPSIAMAQECKRDSVMARDITDMSVMSVVSDPR